MTAASLAAPATIVVAEVFGPTIQGEGPHAGHRAGFVRLGGCNLTCTWCDTPYTWDGKRFDLRLEMHRRSVADVAAQVFAMDVELAILTGGEPLLQQGTHARWQHGLTDLAVTLAANGVACEIETNGTIAPRADLAAAVRLFVVSPKLAHAGMTTMRTLRPDVLLRFAELAREDKAVFKFVARTPADVASVAALMRDLEVPTSAVWVMPEGVAPAVLLARGHTLIEPVLAHGFNYTTRLHILLWGTERQR